MEVSGQLHAPTTLRPGNNKRLQINKGRKEGRKEGRSVFPWREGLPVYKERIRMPCNDQ
jgi:hypothetical protein